MEFRQNSACPHWSHIVLHYYDLEWGSGVIYPAVFSVTIVPFVSVTISSCSGWKR